MPDDSLLLISCNIVGTHAGEEIVRVIVGADVIEAELPVFPLAQPPFGGAVRRGFLAVRPLAGGTLRTQPTVLVGLDPDTVEQRRVVFHDRSICTQRRLSFKT